MIQQTSLLEVWLDDDLGPVCRVGILAHDRGQNRFTYDTAWLKNPRSFALDPALQLDSHPFFPRPDQGNFGIFLDSSPDRWVEVPPARLARFNNDYHTFCVQRFSWKP